MNATKHSNSNDKIHLLKSGLIKETNTKSHHSQTIGFQSKLYIVFSLIAIFCIIGLCLTATSSQLSTPSISRKLLSDEAAIALHPNAAFQCYQDYNDYFAFRHGRRREPDYIQRPLTTKFIGRFITELKHNTRFQTAIKNHMFLCQLFLDFDDYKYYQLLHQELAKLYPIESDRPVIELFLADISKQEWKYKFGVLGGVGQLADAEVLNRLMDIINFKMDKSVKNKIRNNAIINIHSNAPPRSFMDAFWRGHAFSYSKQISYFLTDYTIGSYLLASNTAHLNYGYIQTVLAPLVKNPFKGVRNYENVIYKTVQMIRYGPYSNIAPYTDYRKFKVLIIGTTAAYDADLYNNALYTAGIDAIKVTKKQQENIQIGIDFIKKDKMMEAIDVIINGNNLCDDIMRATHVLMGCSELSLAVTQQRVQQCVGDSDHRVIYVDTTQLMAEYIAGWLIGEEAIQESVSEIY